MFVGYTAIQAARLAGSVPARLDAWRAIGLVTPGGPAGSYTAEDLVAVRVAAALLDSGAPMRAVRAAVDAVPGDVGGERGLRLVVGDVRAVACHDDAALARAVDEMPVALDPLVDAVRREQRAFDAERRAFVDDLCEPVAPLAR